MEYKSDEERYFADYLDELKEAGIVKEWWYELSDYEVSEQMFIECNGKKKTLFRAVRYTPDFKIEWKDDVIASAMYAGSQLHKVESMKLPYFHNGGFTYVDVKGTYGGNTRDVAFPYKQKLMMSKYGIYVQKVMPMSYTRKGRHYKGMFEKTFTPQSFINRVHKRTGKPLKKQWDYKPLNEYLDECRRRKR